MSAAFRVTTGQQKPWRVRAFCALLMTLAAIPPASAKPETLEDVRKRATVYIKCTPDDGSPDLFGTGVIVSSKGHVLTAKHILEGLDPAKVQCRGNIGTAVGSFDLDFRRDPIVDNRLDALLLEARSEVEDNDFDDFMHYCAITREHQLQQLVAIGFPGRTKSRQVSVRSGVLSTTVRAEGEGLLETDIMTTPGMSGGPTVFAGNTNLVGIIVEAKGDLKGTVAYYGILPVAEMNSDLTRHMTQASQEDCAPMRLLSELDAALQEIEAHKAEIAELKTRYEALEKAVADIAALRKDVDPLLELNPHRELIKNIMEVIKDNQNASPDKLDQRLISFEQILDWDASFQDNGDLRVTYSKLAGNELAPTDSFSAATRIKVFVNDIDEATVVPITPFKGQAHTSYPNYGTFDLVDYERQVTNQVENYIEVLTGIGNKAVLPHARATLTFTYTFPGDPEPRTEKKDIEILSLRPLVDKGTN